ncbi:hypothetical protein D3C80_1472590 [compost metagenome]
MPVVCRITADHQIKAGIVKRQRFRHALLYLNIVQPFIHGRLANHLQHLRGQIISHRLSHFRRRRKAGVPGPAPQIEQPGTGVGLQQCCQTL